VEGNRNRSGYILACRLKEQGVAYPEARAIMHSYAQAVRAGSKPYTMQEALASLRSANRPKR
jgi:hypothetical protein